jgi:hypothetical protein
VQQQQQQQQQQQLLLPLLLPLQHRLERRQKSQPSLVRRCVAVYAALLQPLLLLPQPLLQH